MSFFSCDRNAPSSVIICKSSSGAYSLPCKAPETSFSRLSSLKYIRNTVSWYCLPFCLVPIVVSPFAKSLFSLYYTIKSIQTNSPTNNPSGCLLTLGTTDKFSHRSSRICTNPGDFTLSALPLLPKTYCHSILRNIRTSIHDSISFQRKGAPYHDKRSHPEDRQQARPDIS